MKVILLTDVKKVGQRGSVVDVADGYAHNVLIPKKQAMPATPENLKAHQHKETLREKERASEEERLAQAVRTLSGKEVRLSVKANNAGGLFKSITPEDVQKAIADRYSIIIPGSSIHIDEHIKQVGNFPFTVSGGGAKAHGTLHIEKDEM